MIQNHEQANRVGDFLRQLRKARGLTLAQTAQAAGIGRVTLNRWETGVHQPRLAEMEALLLALDANAKQKRQALAYSNAPGVQRRILHDVRSIAEQKDIGSLPNGGDLLRAMRMRRGLSLEDAAAQAGISARTLRFWEKAEIWPSCEALHRLCYALGAQETEIVALTTGRFALSAGEALSEEAIRERFRRLRKSLNSPLDDVRFLEIEAQAWSKAARQASGRLLLAEIYATHAYHLSTQNRFAESRQYADRALNLSASGSKPEAFWYHAGASAARATVYAREQPAPKRGLEQIVRLLPLAREVNVEGWAMADQATYLAMDGKLEEALAISESACCLAVRVGNEKALISRQRDKARLLLKAERPAEAMPLLLFDEEETPASRVTCLLLRVETLLALEERHNAHDELQAAMGEIAAHHLTHLQPQAETLAGRL